MSQYWHWRCGECNHPWRISRRSIEAKKKSGELIRLGCNNCGYVNGPTGDWKPKIEGEKTWLPCIVFAGPEARLSPGTPSGDLWKDANGATFTSDKYIERYDIDPKINRDWRLRGSPIYVE